jgi:hypothetical protein
MSADKFSKSFHTLRSKAPAFKYVEEAFPDLVPSSTEQATLYSDNELVRTDSMSAVLNKIQETGIIEDRNKKEGDLPNGWIELNANTARHVKNTSHRVPEKSKYVLHDEYIHSLSDEEYNYLAHRVMDGVVAMHERRTQEFIDLHGYDYFEKIYLSPEPIHFDEEEEEEEDEYEEEEYDEQ